ncbi:MAG: penicillin-binding protein 2 [Alphaproteobacteria bacterium]|nr:penicillin-binding protein 2 [Alphaproteobacteria bacterium]
MKHDGGRGKILTRRALVLAGGKAALLAALAGRLYYLQVVQAPKFAMLADENRINIRVLAPPRGHIVDRFGVPLAVNRPTYRAVVIPEQAGNIDATFDAVARLVPLTEADRRRVLRDMHNRHSFVPIALREDMNWNEMARIDINAVDLAGVSIDQGLIRHYPFGVETAHVVGYVAPVSEQELDSDDPLVELPDFRVGKSGIEKQYDLELRGTAGTSEVEVNAFGKVVRELAREDGISGEQIVVGLDMALQDLAMRRCTAQGSASAVVLDSWTGEVLALASAPGFDPSVFASGLTPAQWKALIENPYNPLTDKAIAGIYAPGSTFKPVVAMAALEAGVITPETEFFCPGEFHLGNAVWHCWKKGGHGTLALRRAIKESCDVFFYHTADLLGIDRIAQMANRFGLGVKVDIDIPGAKSGLIPTRAWKLATTGVPWQRGETISCGIGQSFVSLTPLQLVIYVAGLATGHLVKPVLSREQGVMTPTSVVANEISRAFAPVGVQEKNLDVIRDAMYGVVNEPHGTAYGARIAEPAMAMAGKTGTSQIHHIAKDVRDRGVVTGTKIPWKDRDHALFMAFAPTNAPRYVCSVVVEHGGTTGGEGGAVAAPIARDLLLEAQKRDPARRVPNEPFDAPDLAQG